MIDVRLNGRSTAHLDVLDRGLLYGDGLFETMRVRGHRVALLDWHLQRLQEGCRRLRLPMPAQKTLRLEINQAAQRWPEAVIKLIVTRGAGARGYRAPRPCRPTRLLISEPYKHAAAQPPVRVRLCATRLSVNPALAGLKSLNRLDSVLARSEWRDARVQEGLMLDVAGNVVCGTMTNVFVGFRGTLITPLLDSCGVAGVMRRWILQHAHELGVPIIEGRLRMSDLETADEILLTNALIGIWSVGALRLEGKTVRPAQQALAQVLRQGFQQFLERPVARRRLR